MDQQKINALNEAEENMKLKYAQMQQAQCCQAAGATAGNYADDCAKAVRPSLRAEAEMRVGRLRTEADKADRAAAFFREHPEFDEFIQLIRSGVIGI